ncbi:MAG: MauE/DoxX family redox-associated membrane protein [Opitutaceae bacterium]|jgi:uncharacterized membrane protein
MKISWQTVGAWILAIVFGWAGATKVADPSAFANSITGFRLVPWPVGVALALYLPWLELIIAAALLVPRWRQSALLLAAVLSTIFVVVWAITWARGLDVSCGCFGGQGTTNAAWALLRAILLSGFAWGMVIRVGKPEALPNGRT